MPGNFIMPQSDDRVLCVCITTRITRDWFLGNARIADDIIARHGEMRLLVYYKNYQGWDEDATREDSSAFINQGSYFRKFADAIGRRKLCCGRRCGFPSSAENCAFLRKRSWKKL